MNLTLGQRISRAMTESGKSVEDVAKACDVSVQAVYTWMRDEIKDLRNKNLFPLADLTGFEARWLDTGEGPERPLYRLDSHIGRALAVMEHMPEPYQAQAVKQIDSLAELANQIRDKGKGNGTDG